MSDPHHLPDPENVVAFRKRPPKPLPAAAREQTDAERARVRTNVAALVLAAVLVFFGWLLVQKLGHNAKVEDCLMSGRTNCAPIDTPSRD